MPALRDFHEILAEQIGPENAEVFVEHATLVELQRGEVLLRDQAPVDAMYLLLEGRVGMSVEVAGHSIHLGSMDAGNWIGEVAYFSASRVACSSVVAETDIRLMRLGYAEFGALAHTIPGAACRLTHVLVTMLIHRLRATVQNPVLDADGQLLMLGNLSLPAPPRAGHGHEHGVVDFLRKLMGVR
jgi:CRP-like cAMP-binding protein